jgi:hypothetical protein
MQEYEVRRAAALLRWVQSVRYLENVDNAAMLNIHAMSTPRAQGFRNLFAVINPRFYATRSKFHALNEPNISVHKCD